eukprot:1150654-Pelagomonas_calceolata.AAC.2
MPIASRLLQHGHSSPALHHCHSTSAADVCRPCLGSENPALLPYPSSSSDSCGKPVHTPTGGSDSCESSFSRLLMEGVSPASAMAINTCGRQKRLVVVIPGSSLHRWGSNLVCHWTGV